MRAITSLHKWQRECLDIWLGNSGRGIVNVATGAGKTILALACINALYQRLDGDCALKVKIVVPKIFMLSQWSKAIIRELSIQRADIGVCYGGAKDDTSKNIMLYVLNSARYTLAKDVLKDLRADNPVLLICDECHHMGSTENAKIFDFMPLLAKTKAQFFSLGLSATPDSPGYDTVLAPSLGKEIYKYGMSDALDDGIVSRYLMVNVSLKFTPDEAAAYGELTEKLGVSLSKLKRKSPVLQTLAGRRFYERVQYLCEHGEAETSALAATVLNMLYRRKELVYLAEARIECACSLIDRIAEKSRIIVFGERVDMCETLYNRLSAAYPGKVGRYHSAMSAQAKQTALENYENAVTDILVSCRAFDEGLDIPDTGVGILLSSTGSVRQRVQRVGRLLRSYAGGGVKSIYYLYIPESSEETSLLAPDRHRDIMTMELAFDSVTREFCSPLYDELAGRLISSLTEYDNLTDEQWDEIAKNLRAGTVSGDYQLSPEECRSRAENAKSLSERNYWIVMLRLSMLYAQNGEDV